MAEFELTEKHKQWARKRPQKVPASELIRLLMEQKGLCKLSQAPLVFDVSERTPIKDGPGCHPLSPAVDHKDPCDPKSGFQIVCYALNDLKGHLPVDCFDALSSSNAWKELMRKWKEKADKEPGDREGLMRLIRPNPKMKRGKMRTA